jgi:hypothetical protein
MKKIIYSVLIVNVLSCGVVWGAAEKETYEKEYKLIAEEKEAREKAEQLNQQILKHPISIHNRQVDRGAARWYKTATPDLEKLEKQHKQAKAIAEQKESELWNARNKEYTAWGDRKDKIPHPIHGNTMQEWEAAKKSKERDAQSLAKIKILSLKYELEVANYHIQTTNLNPLLFDYERTRNNMKLQITFIKSSITDLQNALNQVIQEP